MTNTSSTTTAANTAQESREDGDADGARLKGNGLAPLHDTGGGNPYAHVLLTMRPIQQDGAWSSRFSSRCRSAACVEVIRARASRWRSESRWWFPTKVEADLVS